MKIGILVGDKGNVDLDSAVCMTDAQKDTFVSFLKELFSPEIVIETRTEEMRDERIGDKFFFREWHNEEYEKLLEIDTKTVEDLVEEIGRSWMSVNIKRGQFIPDYLEWISRKGKNLMTDDTKKLIEGFMKYRESQKQGKKILRQKKKKLLEKLEALQSPDRRKALQLNAIINKLDLKELIEEDNKKTTEIRKMILDIDNKLDEPY